MAYLIGQIWLLIAAGIVVGLVLGWLLAEARSSSTPAETPADTEEADALRVRVDELLEDRKATDAELHRLTDEKTSLENQLSMLGTRLREAQRRNRPDSDGDDDDAEAEADEHTDAEAPSASADA